MAEVIGVVASGIGIGTLAARIAISVVKLKGYWDQVNEAPEAVESLLEIIELYHSIFAGIEEDQKRNTISPLVADRTLTTKCLDICKKAESRLKDLVDELGADLCATSRLRRKKSALKVVLNEKKIEKHTKTLEHTVQLLTLAYQWYTSSLSQHQPDIIVARLSQIILPPPVNLSVDSIAHENDSNQGDTQNYEAPTAKSLVRNSPAELLPPIIKRYDLGFFKYEERGTPLSTEICDEPTNDQSQQERDRFKLYLRGPAWLINKAWELQGRRACSGWDFNFLTYNILPSNSDVFKCIETGSAADLQDLFKNKKASPFDRDERGKTLLHRAAACRSVEICKLLLDNGAKKDAEDYNCRTPLWATMEARLPLTFSIEDDKVDVSLCSSDRDLASVHRSLSPIGSAHLGLTKMLLPNSGLNVLVTQPNGSEYDILFLTDEGDLSIHIDQLKGRAVLAFNLTYRPYCTPKLFRMALSTMGLDVSSYKHLFHNGVSILHVVARKIGWSSSNITNGRMDRIHPWGDILQDCVTSGCDLHAVDSYGRTPFLEAIAAKFPRSKRNLPRIEFDGILSSIRTYLHHLKEAGVELASYGRKERKLHRQLTRGKSFILVLFWDNLSYTGAISLNLVGFTYGPSPDDWTVWLSEPTDIFAGDFWRMIESPWEPERIPGAWIE